MSRNRRRPAQPDGPTAIQPDPADEATPDDFEPEADAGYGEPEADEAPYRALGSIDPVPDEVTDLAEDFDEDADDEPELFTSPELPGMTFRVPVAAVSLDSLNRERGKLLQVALSEAMTAGKTTLLYFDRNSPRGFERALVAAIVPPETLKPY